MRVTVQTPYSMTGLVGTPSCRFCPEYNRTWACELNGGMNGYECEQQNAMKEYDG